MMASRQAEIVAIDLRVIGSPALFCTFSVWCPLRVPTHCARCLFPAFGRIS